MKRQHDTRQSINNNKCYEKRKKEKSKKKLRVDLKCEARRGSFQCAGDASGGHAMASRWLNSTRTLVIHIGCFVYIQCCCCCGSRPHLRAVTVVMWFLIRFYLFFSIICVMWTVMRDAVSLVRKRIFALIGSWSLTNAFVPSFISYFCSMCCWSHIDIQSVERKSFEANWFLFFCFLFCFSFIRITFDFIDLFDIKATIDDSTDREPLQLPIVWCGVQAFADSYIWYTCPFNCKQRALNTHFSFSFDFSGFAMQIQYGCGAGQRDRDTAHNSKRTAAKCKIIIINLTFI